MDAALIGFAIAVAIIWLIHRIAHISLRSEKKTILAMEVAALTLLLSAFILLEALEVLGKAPEHIGLISAFVYVIGSLTASLLIYKVFTRKAH